MLQYLTRRILSAVPVLAIVCLIVFLMLRLTPGDPAAAIVGDLGTAEDIARVRSQLGLDKSLAQQFAIWIGHLARGDLGESYYYKKSISSLLQQRLEPTLSLAAVTTVLATLIAVPLGIVAAWRHGGWLDRALMGLSVLGFSVPIFVVGYVIVWLFGLHWELLPTQGYVRMSEGLTAWARHLILPAATLTIVYLALIARVTRAAVAEALTEDYIRTARSKGISELRVLLRHALHNASVPIVTVIGIGIALLIGGVVVTETVFAIPGLGQLTVDAVLSRDHPLIQGLTLFFSITYVTINLLIDLSYLLLDPRIRY